MKYDFSNLWSEQFFGFNDFKVFYDYASDKNSQINFYKQLGAVHLDANGTSKIETPQVLIDHHLEINESVLNMIKNQIIVFLFARYESIIQNTMKCLICDNSERILKFIKVYPNYKEFIGFTLKEFVKYESKEEYVTVISERLSSKILTGKPSKVIERLRCLLSFENINTDMLDELMIKRNNIVHEGKNYKIEMNELQAFYETIDNLLKIIALALKKIKITVIDHGALLTEEPKYIAET